MTVRFWIFWILSILKVISSPFVKWGQKLVFSMCVVIGIWLIVGVSTHQSKYLNYEQQYSTIQSQINQLRGEKQKLEQLLSLHPSSRDILISLGEVSFRLHDEKMVQFVLSKLENLDPNHPQVREFRTFIAQ